MISKAKSAKWLDVPTLLRCVFGKFKRLSLLFVLLTAALSIPFRSLNQFQVVKMFPKQFQLFQQQFMSVVYPEDLLMEGILMLRTRCPISKPVETSWIRVNTERVKRVLMMHPGKQNKTKKSLKLWSPSNTTEINLKSFSNKTKLN